MFHFFDAITNTKGDAQIGYFVQAIDTTALTAVTIYADANSTPIVSASGVANMAKVDGDGNASFWVIPGTYHLDIYATDSTTFVKRISSIPMLYGPQGDPGPQGPAGDVAKAADRTALAAIAGPTAKMVRALAEAGREGLFVFDVSDLSAQVTADPLQGIHVPPSSDTSGASGAWVRKFDGPILDGWFGPDGVNDVNAIEAACALASALDHNHVRISDDRTCTATLTFDETGLTVEGTGATVSTTADNQAVNFAGASLKIRGVHFDLAASGADPAPYLEFNGADTVFEDNTVTRSAAAHIPCYVRSTATGLRFRNNHCTWYGGINMISNCKDIEITGNSFINPGAASDDGIAIKAVGGISENILIADNYFENMADFVGIGSEIGATAATDSTYSNIARAITIVGNRGKNCTRMLMVKPGGVDGVDVRDGTVRGVTFSNNTLIDESGTAMLQPILIQPGRGARVFDVTGKNNKAIGRCTTGDQVGYYIFLRNDGTGTADVVVDNIDIGIEIIDRYGGVASGGSAPGYPFAEGVKIEKADPAHGTATNVTLDVAVNGTLNSGISIGTGLDDAVYIRRAALRNITASGSSTYGGIFYSSRIGIGRDISVSMASGSSAKAYKPGPGGDIVSNVDHVLLKDVAAGSDSNRAMRWAAPQSCFVHKVEIVNHTSAPLSNDIDYIQHEVRNEDGAAGTQAVNNAATGGIALPADTFNTIYDATSLSGALYNDTFYSRGGRLSYTKNDFGSGVDLTDAYLRISWAPF
jgi:hypothetical protein